MKGSRSGKVISLDAAKVKKGLNPGKAKKASERKWGKAVIARGFCIVPSLILRAQARLKLEPVHLAILLHLMDHWWQAERKPHPSKNRLAERLGLTPRRVQSRIAELEAMGLVKRIERTVPGRGKRSNFYDLSGLVARLKELEPEFRKADEAAREKQRAVARPGLRHRQEET